MSSNWVTAPMTCCWLVKVYHYSDILNGQDSFEHLPDILKQYRYEAVEIRTPSSRADTHAGYTAHEISHACLRHPRRMARAVQAMTNEMGYLMELQVSL